MSDHMDIVRAARAYPFSDGDRIMISGVAGKFPNSKNVAEFRDNLYNKVISPRTFIFNP